MLLKEIKEDINLWKHTQCSWIGRLNVIKMLILPKEIYTYSAFPIKIPLMFLAEIEKLILKFIWHYKGPHIPKTVLKKKNKTGELTLSDFRTYCKATVIKTV